MSTLCAKNIKLIKFKDWKGFLDEWYNRIPFSLKIFEKSHNINLYSNNKMLYFRESPNSEQHYVNIELDFPNITRNEPDIITLKALPK